ncbi:phage tail tape measure protein [Lachnospiraceae bacterium 46-15]
MNATGYADEVLEITQRLSELQAEMEAVNQEFSGQENSLEALQKKHEILQKVLEKQAEKQEILTRTLREAEQSQAGAGERTETLRQALSEAEEQIARTNQEISQNERYMREAESAADHCATSINRYGEEVQTAGEGTERLIASVKKVVTENLAPKVSDMAEKLAGSVFEAAKGMEQGANRIQASTDVSGSALKQYQEIMGEVYQNNYGDSFHDVAEAISQVVYHMGELDGNAMQEVTENAFALKDTFEMDVNDTLAGANALMAEMGVSSEKAFGLIASGAQNGLNRSGDMLDKIAEYSPLWGKAGFSAEEMFSILDNGLDAGASDLDTVNDFVKEFINALSDGRVEKSLSGFSQETQNLFGQMKAGEATAAEVFQGVIHDLSSAENQQKALMAAGNIWSDLEEGNAGKVITSLGNLSDSYSGVKGKMNELKEIRYDDLDSQISQVSRTLQVQLGEQMQKILPVMSGGLEFLSDNLVAVEASVAGVATAILVFKALKFAESIEGATLAMKALNLVTSANPIGIIATVAGIAAAGLTAFAFSAGEAETESQKAYNEMKTLSKEAENLKKNVQESRAAMEEETRSTVSQYLAYETMSDRLYELNDQLRAGNLETKEASAVKAEMRYLVNELNSSIPELNLHMDEQTGILKNSKAATDECIASMKQRALVSVMEERMTELYRQQGEALMMQGEATAKRNAAQQASEDIMERAQNALNAYMELMTEYDKHANDTTMTVEDWGKIEEEIAKKHGVTVDEMKHGNDIMNDATIKTQEYNSAIAESEKTIEDATTAQEESQKMIDESKAGMIESMRLMDMSDEEIRKQAELWGISTDTLQENNEAVQGNTDIIQENTDAAEANASAVEVSTEAQKKALQSLKEKYEEIRTSIEQSMEQKISLFDAFDGGETVGLDTIEENLNSQLEGLTNWRDNMAQLAGQVGGNISAELYNHLVELGPDAANIVQEMVNSLDPDKGDGGEKLREIAERYAAILDIKELTAENLADVSFIIQSALGEISESSTLDFENLMESLDEAKEAVTEKGGAISEGVEESFTETVETLRQCGAQIPEGLAESLANGEITIEDAIGKMQGSIEAQFTYLSSLAQKAGIPIPEGIREGIVQGGEAAVQAMNELLGLLAGTQEEGKETGEKSGEAMIEGTAQGAAKASGKVSQEAANTARNAVEAINVYKNSFQNSGYHMMSGFANGLNAGSGLVYEKIREIMQAAVDTANRFNKTNSPSKRWRDEVAKPVTEGLALGLNQGKKDVTKASADVARDTLDTAKTELDINKISEQFEKKTVKKLKSGMAFGVKKTKKNNDGKKLAQEVAKRAEKFIEEEADNDAEAKMVWDRLLEKAQKSKIKGYQKNLKKLIQEQQKEAKKKQKEEKEEQEKENRKYGASGDALEEYKKVRNVSAKAEVEYWDIVRKQYKAGTEERLKADKKYLDALEAYNEKRKDLEENYKEKCEKTQDELKKKVDELEEAYESAFDKRKSTIESAFGLFDEFKSEADAPEILLANMQSQVAGYALWVDQLEKLEEKKILNDSFIEKLREMGPAAAATILSLGMMTEEQLKQANEAYEQKEKLAEAQALKDTEAFRIEIEGKIAEAEKAAKEKLEEYKDTYDEAMEDLSAAIEEPLKNLANQASTIGEQTAMNLISGLRDEKIQEELANTGAVLKEIFVKEVEGLASAGEQIGKDMLAGILEGLGGHLSIQIGASGFVNSLEEAVKASAGIHSPSKRFRDVIGVQIPAGIAEGIEENTQAASAAGTRMIETMLEQSKEKLNQQQMVLSGEMETINGGAGIAALNGLASENVNGQTNVTVDNSGVADVVGNLAGSLASIREDIRRMKVVLDTGAVVGEISEAVGSELTMQARRW